MAHVYKVEEWENNGRWFCGDVSALAADSNDWFYAPQLLNLTPTEYVKMLIEKFHTEVRFRAEKNVLIFSFSSLESCRKYKNYINKIARDKNFVTY